MFHAWDGFYLLIGSASAGLIGLMFVVATLMTGTDSERAERGARYYTTPTVFHLGVVFVLSTLSAVPGLSAPAAGMIIAICALAGLAYVGSITPRIRAGVTTEPPHWSDVWCYGVAPGLVYLGLGSGATMIWISPSRAPYAVGLLLLALLLVAIRNAWDLVTWLAPRASRLGADSAASPPGTE